jgi:hypothetical protein
VTEGEEIFQTIGFTIQEAEGESLELMREGN